MWLFLKHLFWPVDKSWFTCGFVQWLKRSSFVWLFLKHLFWPVKKPRFTCDFVQCLKRSSFVWLFLKDSFGQSINCSSLVVSRSG